ncbi:homoserine kinase [Glycomyces salinus]|uniref:homoserine kinase n=1 Tax=Glycomyces salinus TaxID=980294 RepID=UPI0018EE3C11|nr:homoserine kinase [Glycomyces salinus]
MSRSATVAVPATSANLGPGFDSLGLALGLFDEVTAETVEFGVRVEVTGEGAGTVAADERHLVASSMLRTFEALGVAAPGLRLKCRNRIPHARGLGSSSAAIVAGIMLADELAGGGLTRARKLKLASEIEGHPDNVAPCLLGGFTIAYTTEDGAKAVSVEPSPRLHPWVFVPSAKGLTAEARAALPDAVPHADAVFNLSRAALLVEAITRKPSRLFDATEDRLHQSQRAAGMPESTRLLDRLRTAGIAAAVSGAGPTVIALCVDGETAPVESEGFSAMRLEVVSGAAITATSADLWLACEAETGLRVIRGSVGRCGNHALPFPVRRPPGVVTA